MKTKRQVGIWMDYSHAYLMEISLHGIVADIVEPVNTSKSKNVNRDKALEQQSAYYTRLKVLLNIMMRYYSLVQTLQKMSYQAY